MKKNQVHYIDNITLRLSQDRKQILVYFNTTTGSFCIPINCNYLRKMLSSSTSQKNEVA